MGLIGPESAALAAGGTSLAGQASRGALRPGAAWAATGNAAGRRRSTTSFTSVAGRALGCFVTSPILSGGGLVRAGAALGRPAAWNQTELEGKLRSGLCGPRGPARPAQLRSFRCAGSRPKTRRSLRQSETASGSASVSRALDSELEAPHGCT
jgi:hypothetical protein